MGSARRGMVGLLLLGLLGLSGCSGVPGFGGAAPSVAPSPTTAATEATASVSTEPSTPASKAPRNDLASGEARRTFSVGGLTVSATYSSPLPAARWTPDVTKPLNVSLTAYSKSARGQKIYLTRVRANVGVYDESGPLDSPDPFVDLANISPGFIVTFPYTYGQVFVLGTVDAGARFLIIDFTYEFLIQVTPNSKDFAKQTGRDSLTVALR